MLEPERSGAIRHPTAMTEALWLGLRRPPADSTVRYLFLQVNVAALCAAIRNWTFSQIPGSTRELDQLVCDGIPLRGSVEPTTGGGSAFTAKVRIYTAALGVVISQACSATGENPQRAVMRQLLGELDLEGVC